jgi:hypothetical protein
MYLGFENPGMAGGVASSFVLPLLLGGVLKGDTSASEDASGASDARAVVSIDCGLLGIFGLPARFIGGGMDGTVDVGRSFLRGSAAGVVFG